MIGSDKPFEDLDLFPKHLREKGYWKLQLLRRWANGLRMYFHAPIWLVGSALKDDNEDPRDWDIRVCIPDEDFKARFGLSAFQWKREQESGDWSDAHFRWGDDCAKRTKEGWRQTQLNCDFQVYPECHWPKYDGLPRVRLDTRKQEPPMPSIFYCDCAEFFPSWKLPGPQGIIYAIECFPSCHRCGTAAGIRIYQMTPEEAAKYDVRDLPNLKFNDDADTPVAQVPLLAIEQLDRVLKMKLDGRQDLPFKSKDSLSQALPGAIHEAVLQTIAR